MSARLWLFTVTAVALACVGARAEPAPLEGCYERVYDAEHLKAHRGQIVRRVKVKIGASAFGKPDPADKNPIVADAAVMIWVGKRSASFDSLGACSADGEALVCNASLSAAETDQCKKKSDGVHACRMDSAEAGSFKLERKPDGLLLSVRERWELPQSASDVGPYLYLSPSNRENHDFLLKPAPAETCK